MNGAGHVMGSDTIFFATATIAEAYDAPRQPVKSRIGCHGAL